MHKKILFFLLWCSLWTIPVYGSTTSIYAKHGSSEIVYYHPTLSLCTRVKSASTSNAKGPAIRFDSMNPTDGCKIIYSGTMPTNAAVPSHQLVVRLWFMTTAQTSKVVGLGVRAYVVVPSGLSGAGPEKTFSTAQVTMTSGSARNFYADQEGYVEGTVTVKKQTGGTCDSTCDNQEVILVIEPTSSMTIPAGEFWLTDVTVSFDQ